MIGRGSFVEGVVGMLAPAELPGADEDPFSLFTGWDTGQLLWLAILIPVAVLVFSIGSRRVRSQLRMGAILPRGRDRSAPGDGHLRDEAWRTAVQRLEGRPPTRIADAQSGLVRIVGVITGSTGNLGGAPGRECVWRNRPGAGPKTAVAAELLFVADESGRCGIEELEQARVVAPVDKVGAHYESTSLHVGDRIEVIGRFERDVLGQHEDPTRLVYGTLGGDGRLDVHVLERPSPETEPEPSRSPEAPARAATGTGVLEPPTQPDVILPPEVIATLDSPVHPSSRAAAQPPHAPDHEP